MPRRIRSVGSAVPVWLIVNTPPLTSARPTVPGPSGVVVIASMATRSPGASIARADRHLTGPAQLGLQCAPCAGACDVAGATSTRASTGVIVTVRPTSGPATGVGSGAQFGSVPTADRRREAGLAARLPASPRSAGRAAQSIA